MSSDSTPHPAPPPQQQQPYKRIPYTPPPAGTPFPYTAADLTPADATPDAAFYSAPRFVTHIDDAAIADLRAYYAAALPRAGRLLDLCSSWVSHLPPELEAAAAGGALEVVGLGMNARELERNAVLAGRWGVRDLNADPRVGGWSGNEEPDGGGVDGSAGGAGDDGNKQEQGQDHRQGQKQLLDATTCVVSIDYLTQPLSVLTSLRARTVPGGSVHLVVSNRCFPTKAVARWLRVPEAARLHMVADYLWHSGWRDVEVLELSDGRGAQGEQAQGGVAGFMAMLGMGGARRDPLWVVRARNVDGDGEGDGDGVRG